MEQIREEIDDIDAQLLKLLARRFSLCERIAAQKHAKKSAITDPGREARMFAARTKSFAELGFDDPSFVARFFAVIIAKSKELQERAMRKLEQK